ncbi:VOC family protein [Candidatus Saccharibacteria bacterium]|nr:VOC family protein [Candidatus Saccharibacteria bacterium]
MNLELFINFNGNCQEALEFYSKIFKSEITSPMTYAQAPPDSGYEIAEADKDRVMYASLQIGGETVMFMDFPSDSEFIAGNNINPTINSEDKEEIKRLFNELKEGGKVYCEPQATFYSELYCMVEDKFGVIWQILHYLP